jgi:cholesterol 7alpha-monooxygenase
VIASAENTRPFFNDIGALSIDGFLNQALIAFGCAPERLDRLWRLSEPTEVNPQGKNLIHLTEDLFKQDLVPGLMFGVVMERYQKGLNELLAWDRLVNVYPSLDGISNGVGGRTEPISLYEMCTDLVVNINQRILFDPALLAIDSNMAVDIRTFTDALWKLFHRSCFIDTSEVERTLQHYTSVFMRYLNLPPQSRKNEMRVIQRLTESLSKQGIHEVDQAAILFMIYWA